MHVSMHDKTIRLNQASVDLISSILRLKCVENMSECEQINVFPNLIVQLTDKNKNKIKPFDY